MLKTYSTSITFNYGSMIIHMVLLVAQVIVAVLYIMPDDWFPSQKFLNSRKYLLLLINLMIQMILGFICY